MLTLQENGWNFRAIKICSDLNLLPLEIDMSTGKIQRQSSKIKIWLWRILFSLAIAHWFYVFGRLLQSTILEPEKSGSHFRWDHFSFHFAFWQAYTVFYFTGLWLFVGKLDECVMIFNQLFVDRKNPVKKMMDEEREEHERKFRVNDETSLSVSVPAPVPVPARALCKAIPKTLESGSGRASVRPLLTWSQQYSLDEILARTYSVILTATVLVILVVFSIDPSRPQLLYSSLPPKYQNVYSLVGFLAVEAVFLIFMLIFTYFSNLCQLLFFSKCQLELEQLNIQLRNLKEKFQNRRFENRDVKREIWILRQILKEMKQLEVFIELFNHSFPPCIFAFKFSSLACSILMYFFTIRHFQDFPSATFFASYTAIHATLVYEILYQKAISIPEKMEQLKNEFLVFVQKSTSTSTPENPMVNPIFRAEMKREIWGIRNAGVKVASFHTLERLSTPKFIDFVVKNVVNLLVAFPR